MFKMAVAVWHGRQFNWKSVDENTRNLIRNINVGDLNCYCIQCSRVLDPKSTEKFCSKYCASQFCGCGAKFKVRMVTDDEEQTVQANRFGHYRSLSNLAEMRSIKAEAELYRTPNDLNPEFTKLENLRRVEGCCQGVDGLIAFAAHCVRCKTRWMHLRRVQLAVQKIFSGEVTWGHCEAAFEILKKMQDMPIPKKEEKFCDACEPACKKRRIY